MKYPIFALIALALPFSAQAGRESGGGHQCKLIVRAKLNELTNSSTEINALLDAGIYLEDLRKVITNTKLEVSKDLYLEGKKVDAINDPETQTIVFDEDRCLKIAESNEAFISLLVHETLGLMRISDQEYALSKRVYQELWHRVPVMSAFQEPRYWQRMEGDLNFTAKRFEIMVRGRTGQQFAADVIKANGPGQEHKLFDGKILIKQDAYYITYDSRDGEIVSVLIEGEDDGIMPEYSTGRSTDNWLCFFKGMRAGTCSKGDDT